MYPYFTNVKMVHNPFYDETLQIFWNILKYIYS